MVFRRAFARRPLARMVGTAARTAVIAGTASAVTGAVQRRQARQAREAVASPGPPADPATGITDDQLNRLERLAELQKSGVLSPAEFETQKAAILGTAVDTGAAP